MFLLVLEVIFGDCGLQTNTIPGIVVEKVLEECLSKSGLLGMIVLA